MHQVGDLRGVGFPDGRCRLAPVHSAAACAPAPFRAARESLGAESGLPDFPADPARVAVSTFASAPRGWASRSGLRGSLLSTGAVCAPGRPAS